MSHEESEIPLLWPRLSMSCYHYSFLHKQLLNCIWIQQKTTIEIDYTDVTGTVAQGVSNVTGKLRHSACCLLLSSVTCKELKTIKLFGPLVKIIFFGTGSSLNVATYRPQSSVIFNPCTDLVSVKLQSALVVGRGRIWLSRAHTLSTIKLSSLVPHNHK